MKNKLEALLVEIMTLFTDEFGKQAILRGGMILRLLDSNRFTNDLDYLLVPFKSKNDVVDKVIRTLNKLENIKVEHSLNSKCLRCIVTREDVTAQVEIKVDQNCEVNVISTAKLARIYNYTPRLINVMSYEVALANKLAAWNERRLWRDIYDIYLFLNMGIIPDKKTLEKRLKKPLHAKNIKDKKLFQNLEEFYLFLKDKIENMDISSVNQELQSLLSEDELTGLDLKFRNIIIRKLNRT